MNTDDKLDFTGERFTPECEREIWYEHYHRYAFAKRLVKDKNILDIACGEGYGSHILAQYAKNVTGMDIDETSVNHAKSKYLKDNLNYQVGSCLRIPLPDNSIDIVVSFETLEHLGEHQQMLREFDRVLKNDGLLVISTPDKKHYSDATGFQNEYHVKELYHDEFKQLLDRHWQEQTWYAQALSFNSIMQKLDSTSHAFTSDILLKNNDVQNTFSQDNKLIESMYYVVIASKQKTAFENYPDLHLFADEDQSIYGHYNAVIRAHIDYKDRFEKLEIKHNKILSLPILGFLIKKFSRQ